MKHLISKATATAATCLVAAAGLGAIATPAVAKASAPTCSKKTYPLETHGFRGTVTTCIDRAAGKTRVSGEIEPVAFNVGLRVRIGAYSKTFDFCDVRPEKFDTGYQTGTGAATSIVEGPDVRCT
ncbi:hypothetical protein ACH4C6_03565 [Streptomyces sp. NPDC017943]|uniref:hypothetical protein n=1 Tax=Streptomyces sp. NPDC017943 TaxID=3365019 RepID=UPI0037BAA0E6